MKDTSCDGFFFFITWNNKKINILHGLRENRLRSKLRQIWRMRFKTLAWAGPCSWVTWGHEICYWWWNRIRWIECCMKKENRSGSSWDLSSLHRRQWSRLSTCYFTATSVAKLDLRNYWIVFFLIYTSFDSAYAISPVILNFMISGHRYHLAKIRSRLQPS